MGHGGIVDDCGWFEQDWRDSHKQLFLLDEDDLKATFKWWMQENIRKASVDLV